MIKSLITAAGILMLSTSTVMAQSSFVLPIAQQTALGVTLTMPQQATHYQDGPFPASVVVPNAGIRRFEAATEATVISVNVAVGSNVMPDDELLLLTGAGVIEDQQLLLNANEQLAIAQQTLSGNQALYEQGGVTERRLREVRAAAGGAKAKVMAAQAHLQTMGVSPTIIEQIIASGVPLAALPVSAPAAGLITEQYVVPGSRVAVGDGLLEMVSTEQLELEIHVPVAQCGQHISGLEVQLNDGSHAGRVTAVGCAVHREDQGILVRAALDRTVGLKPGQLTDAHIITPFGVEGVWQIPQTALTAHDGSYWVFTVQNDEFLPTQVEVLRQTGREAFVTWDSDDHPTIAGTGAIALKAIWLGLGGEA